MFPILGARLTLPALELGAVPSPLDVGFTLLAPESVLKVAFSSSPALCMLVPTNQKVLLPTTKSAPEGCKLIDVPSIVTPGPPAHIVVPAIKKLVGLGVTTRFPIVMALGAGT